MTHKQIETSSDKSRKWNRLKAVKKLEY